MKSSSVISKMSVSITPSRNSLSFSISRLLEKADEEKELETKPEEKDELMSEPDEEAESGAESVDVDDEDDEDVKVHDSEDDEAGADSGRAMDYSAGPNSHPQPHHPAASGIDWYALYALQQQQQHPPGMFPAHLLPPGYPSVRSSGGGPSSSAYLSYSTASGVAPPAGFPSTGSAPPDYQHHHGNPGGIPNAFAALLEATVFKDRLAAGRLITFVQCYAKSSSQLNRAGLGLSHCIRDDDA